MDAAEAWLQTNDPSYLRSRQAWKNIDSETGDCETPPQEIPAGDGGDLELLVAYEHGRYVESVPHVSCGRCGLEFVPQTAWHRYCSEACKKQAKRRRAA